MFLRALFAFLALPGTIGFLVPWLMVRDDSSPNLHAIGASPFVLGVALLMWCTRDFYVTGKGTLAPWSPPKNLVIVGAYHYSRNPMYVGVTLINAGWALMFAAQIVLWYTLIVAICFHLRVVFGEEPWLVKTHGEPFVLYMRRVPRWFIHWKRRHSTASS